MTSTDSDSPLRDITVLDLTVALAGLCLATFWIAEGLLMYFPADIVSSLMKTLSTLSAPGSEFAFTFMEKRSDGGIQFDSQTKLVEWWLRRRGEPFVWGTTRDELVVFRLEGRKARLFM